MKKTFKLFALCVALCALMFALAHALGSAMRPTPLKKASLVWWPQSEENFYAANKWAKYLKDGFNKNGYDLHLVTALTENPLELLASSDIIIIGYPINKDFKLSFDSFKKDSRIYLWALESPIIMEQPVRLVDTGYFYKIFTWRRDLADNEKIFFAPLDTRLEEGIIISKDLSHKHILMMQIATNHYQYETPETLYYKRRDATLWWIKNHPGEYEFYGNYWPILSKGLDEKSKQSFMASYKGYAEDKIKTLSSAFFALAFENTVHRDYVSEKIYDVMKAGTVPVYLGAPNIAEFVPKECFINYADFKNDEELYAFLTHITPEKYQSYLTCIQAFLNDKKIQSLTPESIADSLLKQIF